MQRNPRLLAALATIILLVSVSCNLPRPPTQSSLAEAVQQTLTAYPTGQVPTITPPSLPTSPTNPPMATAVPTLAATPHPDALLPDGAVVYGPAAIGFDTVTFADQLGGYLAEYREQINGRELRGTEIVQLLALETSLNPQLLLGLVEYRTGWVRGPLQTFAMLDHPMGFHSPDMVGLYKELSLTCRYLTLGYYSRRAGTLTTIDFPDGSQMPVDPALNPGTTALQVLFAQWFNEAGWHAALYGQTSFLSAYAQFLGNPWTTGANPIIPAGLTAPELELPFEAGVLWHFTGGPHVAWGVFSPLSAVDFAPHAEVKGCTPAAEWITAAAAGRVVRSENGVVMVDLDDDGYEQTGWVIFYLHVATSDRVPVGTWLAQGDRIGHASCEGGPATGRHVHLARKYNGEWIPAAGEFPMVLSGWQVIPGAQAYVGTLERDGVVIPSRGSASILNQIVR
ncbi:MAG TPA: peptidoglycan DD-metalloendopeptidase family protein [Anaerolineaceae bacterium]|nr:peptidoglycan DD-metalloendopeptidase family protein [Anaerolineaceae bacterium]